MLNTIYLDTETTGLDNNAEIIQLGIIDEEGRVIFDSLVKCEGDIPPEASEVHGIKKIDLVDAPTWPEIHDKVAGILQKASRIKIYNASYDLRMLKQTADRYCLDLPRLGLKTFCVMKAYGNMHFDGEWIKLTDACAYENLDVSHIQAHNAIGDCEMTRMLDREILKEDSRRKKRADYRESLRKKRMALVPSNLSDFPDFGQAYRPTGYKTMSQLNKRDLKLFEFAGRCCDTYGNRGYLFKPKDNGNVS